MDTTGNPPPNDTSNPAAPQPGEATEGSPAPTPPSKEKQLEMEQDASDPAPPEDPTRTYRVIEPASDMWKLAMTNRRAAARDHARICHLNRCLQKERLPLWTFGINQVPDWLRPLPTELVSLIHTQASAITELTRNLLRVNMAHSERQANRYLAHTRQAYEEENDPDYTQAEARLNGITNHYRAREQAVLQRQVLQDDTNRPADQPHGLTPSPEGRCPPPPPPAPVVGVAGPAAAAVAGAAVGLGGRAGPRTPGPTNAIQPPLKLPLHQHSV